MSAWQRIEPTKAIKSGFRQITVKNFQMPDGSVKDFDVFDRDGIEFAGTIALTEDNKVIIAEMFRPGPEKMMQEIPGGTVENNDSPLETAKKELLEETCYEPGEIERLGSVYKDAYMNGKWHYFLATKCVKKSAEQKLDEREFIKIKLITIDELIDNALNGRMADTEAVLLAYERLKQIKEE